MSGRSSKSLKWHHGYAARSINRVRVREGQAWVDKSILVLREAAGICRLRKQARATGQPLVIPARIEASVNPLMD